jgi:hypothetical protein
VARHQRSLVLAVLLVLVVAGCYSLAEPSFRPGDSRDLYRSISRRVVAGTPLVGESACDDPGLTGNAIYLTARTDADEEPRDVYIYVFRTKGWEDSKTAVDVCQAEYEAANPGSVVTRLYVPIWRTFGADWSPQLTSQLREALDEAQDAG